MGQVFAINFSKGKLEPIKTTGLPVGAVVSYADMANDRKKYVVVSAEGGAYGQRCVAVDGSHYTEVSQSSIDGPGGWRMDSEHNCTEPVIWTAEQIADLCTMTDKIMALGNQNRDLKQKLVDRQNAKAKSLGAGKVPSWATHIIVANRIEDKSDIMTDYFGSSTKESIILAFSKHGKDNFAEMRKAAATFEGTKHLGTGCDVWTARVVMSVDIPYEKAHNGGYYKGSGSHWHSELDGYGGHGKKFLTKADAEAFVASQPAPESINFEDFLATFEWEIGFESVEHREKWSMGGGYFLKKGGRRWSGWEVRKHSVGNDTETMIGLGKVGPALLKGSN